MMHKAPDWRGDLKNIPHVVRIQSRRLTNRDKTSERPRAARKSSTGGRKVEVQQSKNRTSRRCGGTDVEARVREQAPKDGTVSTEFR